VAKVTLWRAARRQPAGTLASGAASARRYFGERRGVSPPVRPYRRADAAPLAKVPAG